MGKKKKNKQLKSIDGKVITEEMIGSWSKSLDSEEFPNNWSSIGDPIDGKLPTYSQQTTLSFKAPGSLKMAAEKKAEERGITLSAFIRQALEKEVVSG